MKLTEHEYQYLTGSWRCPKPRLGYATVSAIRENLEEKGLLTSGGFVTERGEEAVKEYEDEI